MLLLHSCRALKARGHAAVLLACHGAFDHFRKVPCLCLAQGERDGGTKRVRHFALYFDFCEELNQRICRRGSGGVGSGLLGSMHVTMTRLLGSLAPGSSAPWLRAPRLNGNPLGMGAKYQQHDRLCNHIGNASSKPARSTRVLAIQVVLDDSSTGTGAYSTSGATNATSISRVSSSGSTGTAIQ